MLTVYLRCLLRDEAAIDDVFQETMIVAWRRLPEFDQSRPFGAWLRGIALNKVREHWRRCKRDPILMELPAMEHLEGAAVQMEECSVDPDFVEQRKEALRACMARLTERAREMVRLRYEEGTRSKEIGGLLNMGAAAVDMALSRARAALRACVAKKMEAVEYD